MIEFAGLLVAVAHIVSLRLESSQVVIETTSGSMYREWAKESPARPKATNLELAQERHDEIKDIVMGYGKHS